MIVSEMVSKKLFVLLGAMATVLYATPDPEYL